MRNLPEILSLVQLAAGNGKSMVLRGILLKVSDSRLPELTIAGHPESHSADAQTFFELEIARFS